MNLSKLYLQDQLSIREIAEKIGMSKSGVWSRLKNIGVQFRKNAGTQRNRMKRRKDTYGYVYLYIPKHPNCKANGYILEHHLVMEEHIGRGIEKNEEIHHIDGIKDNNKIENLFLTTKKEHLKLRSNCEKLVQKMYREGLVGFKDGEYHKS